MRKNKINRAALAKAIQAHAALATEYNAVCSYNFYRADLTRAFLLVDGVVRQPALVRQDDDTWRAFAIMPDGTLRAPDRVIGLPVEETHEEWERVSLEQHRLHVRLHKAARRVERLAAGRAA